MRHAEYYSVQLDQKICSFCCLNRKCSTNSSTIASFSSTIVPEYFNKYSEYNFEQDINKNDSHHGEIDADIGSDVPVLVPILHSQLDTNLIPFVNNQFTSTIHIIVDSTCGYEITYYQTERLSFPMMTNCLENALLFHRAGWNIQIQRQR